VEGRYRARAGALTLLHVTSQIERDILRRTLAEVTTGVILNKPPGPPEPEDDPLHMRVFSDPYLFEPADPDHPPGVPIDEDTVLRLTPAGREVPFLHAVLADWLARCPAGPLALGDGNGGELSVLLYGWVSMVTHSLAGGPLSVEQVCDAVQIVDPTLVNELLYLMEDAGLVEEADGGEPGEEPRVQATEWLRRGVAPLAAAARIELRHPPGDTAPIAALDVEAAFRLTLPLLKLSRKLSGTCALAVELDEGVASSPAGVTARIERGRVVACEVGLDEDAGARASATAGDWLDAVIEPNAKFVRTAGDHKLAGALLRGLHKTLFGSVKRPRFRR
jgi:hypothetical protein